MCVGSTPAPTPAAKLPQAPRMPDAGADRSTDARRRRQRQANAGGTILTGGQGVTQNAPTAQKTALGS